MFDLEIIDAGVRSMSDYREDDLIPHFIYCGWHYNHRKHLEKFIDMIRKKNEKI